MKAAQITKYGDKDALQVVSDAPQPKAAAGELLIEVYAAAVNPFDLKVRKGVVQVPGLPAILGGDFAGVVAEVGQGVTGFQVGEEVYGQAAALSGHGSFAEFTPVKATSVGVKPKNIDFVAAAALPLTGVSAYQALVEHAGLQSGQKILIHGGAGGIGSCAIPLAKRIGAYIATTAAPEDAEYVKSLGANEVIDYKTQDFTQIIHDYDVVYDLIGGETYKKSYQVLKPGGAIVSMLEKPDEAQVSAKNIKATAQFTRVTTERLVELTKLIEQGVIKAQIDKTFPLEQAAEALEYLGQSHHRGKVVLKIKP